MLYLILDLKQVQILNNFSFKGTPDFHLQENFYYAYKKPILSVGAHVNEDKAKYALMELEFQFNIV